MLPKLKNDRLIRALLCQAVDVTPVWMMRQAGRYLPEYRALRKKFRDFLVLCKTPELACEITLQPIERYPLDAAILFSDILTIPDAMGLGLSVLENKGPVFEKTIRCKADIDALGIPDPGAELRYVIDALALTRAALDGRVPLIGFAGSPWTLSVYMIEGGQSKDFRRAKGLLYTDPAAMHALLEKLTQAIICYLNAQIEAGAQAVMLFDTWGGVLSGPAYQTFSLAYLQKIVDQLTRVHDGQRVPVILFTKGAGLWMQQLAATGCDALGVDSMQDIGQVRAQLGRQLALQGNMDPAVLYAPAPVIIEEVKSILARYGYGSGHVFNLGHGVQQHTDPENVAVFIDAVHELSRHYHEDGHR